MSEAVPILRVYRGDDIVEEVELHGDRLTIGRSNKVDITLESTAISRRHAEVIRKPDGCWWINDLYSKCGTIVNGVNEMEHKLEIGDSIEVGEYRLLFRM
jgi:pSer/pThr/pTyr-binding forkhead associated (FHA) protein